MRKAPLCGAFCITNTYVSYMNVSNVGVTEGCCTLQRVRPTAPGPLRGWRLCWSSRPEVQLWCRCSKTSIRWGTGTPYTTWATLSVRLLAQQVVALIREQGILGIAGNYDSTTATEYPHCGCKPDSPGAEELSHVSYGWPRNHGAPETKWFLGALPFRMDLRPCGGHKSRPTLILTPFGE